MEWKSEIALITGGSRGLGRAFAREIAKRGARVVLVARNESELAEAVEETRREGGVAYRISADISDIHSVYRIAGLAAEFAGPPTLVVNGASTLGAVPLRTLLETECEDLTKVLETNLVGPFRLMKALLGPMLLRGSGTVVNISSDAATEAYPKWGAYSVSKAGLEHLTRIWRAELIESGVRFLSFDPGEMDTRMHAQAMPDADPSLLRKPADVAIRLLGEIERLR